MKLYRVTVEHTFFMTAEDDDDAACNAPYCAAEAMKNDQLDLITEQEVESLDEIPEEWRNSYPYGEPTNDTCEQIFKASR